MTDHIIGEAFLDISFGSEEQALEHQDSLERVLESHLLPVIREVFEELPLDGSEAQIDRLELDLGPVRPDELEGELPRRLREKLRHALRDYIVVTKPADTESSRRVSSESSAFDKVTYFLRFGHLKWNTQAELPDALADLLREVLRTAPERMARLFAESADFDTIALRLFAQFPKSAVDELLSVLAPAHSGIVARLTKAKEQLREGRSMSQSETSPGDAAVRGYDLHDQLRRTLVEGQPDGVSRLDEILEELLQRYPWHLLRLYREMQAGEGLSRQVEGLYGVDTLRHLVEAFLTVSDGSTGAVADLREAIAQFAIRSVNQRAYYSGVLERLLRNDLIDLEALAAETGEAGEYETTVEEALQPPTGSVVSEAARIAELPLNRVLPATVAWLKNILSEKASIREFVEHLPEHVLARLLRLAGTADSSQFLAVADVLIESAYRAGMRVSPRQIQLLKWELLFTYPADDLVQHLEQRIAVHVPVETREDFESDRARHIVQAREEWDVLIRAYELYDQLQRQLADESPGRIREILRELVRRHPFQVRRLFRQLHDDGRLRAQVRFYRTARELSDLLDAFLTVSAIPTDRIARIRESISRLELSAAEEKQYYGRLLSRLVRSPETDFAVMAPTPSREEADEELHDALLLALAGGASVQQAAGVMQQLETLMETRPDLARTWVEEIFQSEAETARAISQFPERILIRALGHLGSQRLVESLSAIDSVLEVLDTDRAAVSPHELRGLKWTFLFRHAVDEHRRLSAAQIEEEFARHLNERFPARRRDETQALRIQATLADRREPLSEQALLQTLQERLQLPIAEQLLSIADAVANAYYREGDGLLQGEIARLKWQLIFSDALFEETETHVKEFAPRFQTLLGDRLASLKHAPTPATAVPPEAPLPTGPDSGWNTWLRAYDLYDRLRRRLVDGEPGSAADLTAALEEAVRLYPWQLLRLYREMQAGEGLSAVAISTYEVAELRRLTDALLTVSEWPAGAFDGLKQSIASFAPKGVAARMYYTGVLEQMLRAEAISLEKLSTDAVFAASESAASIHAIRKVVDVLTTPLAERLLSEPRKLDRESIQQIVDALPEDSLGDLLQHHREASQTTEAEVDELAVVLVPDLREGDSRRLTVDALRERLVVRLLRQLRDGGYDHLLESATASLQRWSTTTGSVPRNLERLKWEFLLTYGIAERRDLAEPVFKAAFEVFLETRLGPRPIRAARLYDELRRILILGESLEGGLKIRIEELGETHPDQVRELYREMQKDAHALESIRRIRDVGDLRSLLDTFGSPDTIVRLEAAVLEGITGEDNVYGELWRILILGETLEGGLKGRLEKLRESRPELVRKLSRELQTYDHALEIIQKITDVTDLRSLIDTFGSPDEIVQHDIYEELQRILILGETSEGGPTARLAKLRETHPELARKLHRELQTDPRALEIIQKITGVTDLRSLIDTFGSPDEIVQHDIYEELQRILILGETSEGGPTARLAKLGETHPELARKLHRELQTDPRALEIIQKITGVTDLRSLIDMFGSPDEIVQHDIYEELQRILILGETSEGGPTARLAKFRETHPELVRKLHRELQTDPRALEIIQKITGADLRTLIEMFSAPGSAETPSIDSVTSRDVLERIIRRRSQPQDAYDELHRSLILGEPLKGGVRARLEKLHRSNPEQVRELYRELQTDARALEIIRKIRDVADLRSLIEAFGTPGSAERPALQSFASDDEAIRHYATVLQRMIRNDLRRRIDTYSSRDEAVRHYVAALEGMVRSEPPAIDSPRWPALVRAYEVYDELRQILILGERLAGGLKARIEELAQSHPERIRSLYRELKADARAAENIRKIHDVADLKSLIDAFSDSPDTDPFASSEDVVERLLGKQPPTAESPKGPAPDPADAMKAYLLTGAELIEIPKLVRAAEAMFWNEPARLRLWIEEALHTKAGVERFVRLLPDRLLVRALLGGSPTVNPEILLRIAESLALATVKPEVGLNPRRARQLKWEFLLHFVLVERRTFREQDFTKDFAAFIAAEPNVLPAAELEKILSAEMKREGAFLIAEPVKEKPFQPIELQRGIQLSNVGMVLAAPYLPRLFSQLNLMEGRKFRDFEASERAIHLLQFMVNESEETLEHELVLNKILCGVDPAMPVRQKIELEDREKIMVESLIAAMIQNWKKIGQTSIAGFRESFLQRDGTLKLQEDEWRLKVTPRAFDMLLDYIPWNYSTIRHSWMERVVHVHWR